MGAARKLQGEIDRVLKKVNEGLVDFDSIWDKVHDTENANQKEKFEADLKKEIKKLQRHRDQIKTWISSADIKDKSPLIEARKSIENEMERFKVCEKEAKTKAFSKAALGAAVKADPKEAQREAARDWLSTTVDNVNQKIEELEYEAAQLQENQGKKKGGKAMTRHHEIEQMMQKYQNHTVRLEQCLRCLDNDTVAPEEVMDLKDMLDLFISPEEGCEAEDSYETVDDYYSELTERLDVVDMHVPSATVATHGKHGKNKEARGRQAKAAAAAGALEPVAEAEEEGPAPPMSPVAQSRAAVAAVKAQLQAAGNTNVKLDDEDSRKTRAGANGVAPALPPSPQAASAPTTSTPSFRPPGAPAAPSPKELSVDETPAGPPQPPPTTSTRTSPTPVAIPQPPAISAPLQSPMGAEDGRPSAVAGPSNGALSSPSQQLRPGAASPASQAPAPTPMAAPARPAAASWNSVAAAGTKAPPQQKPQSLSPATQPLHPGAGQPGSLADAAEMKMQEQLAQQMNGLSMLDRTASGPLPPLQQAALQPVQPPASSAAAQAPPGQLLQAAQQLQQQQQQAAAMASQQQLGAASQQQQQQQQLQQQQQQQQVAEVAQQQRPGELQLGQPPPSMLASHALMIMDGCAGRAMHLSSDTDYNSKRFKARHPVSLPTSYPRTPPEILDNPGLFRKMDPEALFFAFYYQPDTYQQYLAAQELKRQSWRYHKHHNAWFQRYAEPSVTTDEYEQGTYVYFDYNIMHDDMQTGWCYRRKENFTFRYDALEDELQVVAAM